MPRPTVPLVPRTCLTCGKGFLAKNSEVKRGNAKVCSRECTPRRAAMPRVANASCAWCGAAFWVPTTRLNSKSGLVFCCREHKDQAQRIGGLVQIQPPHYSTGATSYREKALKELGTSCQRCGYSELPICEVHHKDRNRENNNITNLEVLCPNCHAREHFLAGDGKYSGE